MKSNTYYQLDDDDDKALAKRISEDLNMIEFVFTHNPELKRTRKEQRKKLHLKAHPHTLIFNGAPFTFEDLKAWSDWTGQIIIKGRASIPLQHPAYRQGHEMALQRFQEDTNELLRVFDACRRGLPQEANQ